MRTTITLQDNLLKRAKQQAIREKCTLGDIVNDALRYRLAEGRPHVEDRDEPPLKTFEGSGLQTGVNLHDNATLLNRMEGR